MKKIKSLEQLKQESSEHSLECFIQFGGFRSSKLILWENPGWWVLNYIDESEQNLSTDSQLAAKTSIVEAIDKGALWKM
jgi:hypothetical protein